MSELKKKNKQQGGLWLLAPAVVLFVLVFIHLLHGKNIALLNPKGYISLQQTRLIFITVAILLAVAIPSVSLLFYTAWKYRETNERAKYEPEKRHGKFFIGTIWLIPSFVAMVFAVILWTATHRLAPQNQIPSGSKPLIVQVVALRWKWLFIYPEQNIATVNYVQMPVSRPVEFDLTADEAPMSSFWIPNLGGQLYAMTGMVNRLNLMADTQGFFPGSSPEINGAGFAGMQFIVRSTSSSSFNTWVRAIKHSKHTLTGAAYDALLKPSEYNQPALYSSPENGLYNKVLMKYMAPMHNNMQMMDMWNMGDGSET